MPCDIPMAMEGLRTGARVGCLADALRDHQSMVCSIALHCLRDRALAVDDPEASRRLQAADFDALVQGSVGAGLAPMVRVRSQARGERTAIYGRPGGPDTAPG